MKSAQVPQEIRKLTRLQLQEGLLRQRQENRELRSELGEAGRARMDAQEDVTVLRTALEAIILIAATRTQAHNDEWNLVGDVALTAIRQAIGDAVRKSRL